MSVHQLKPQMPTDSEVEYALDVLRRRILAPPPAPPPIQTGERLLTITQVAERLAISVRSAKRLVAIHALPSQLVLKRRLVREADLDLYISGAES